MLSTIANQHQWQDKKEELPKKIKSKFELMFGYKFNNRHFGSQTMESLLIAIARHRWNELYASLRTSI